MSTAADKLTAKWKEDAKQETLKRKREETTATEENEVPAKKIKVESENDNTNNAANVAATATKTNLNQTNSAQKETVVKTENQKEANFQGTTNATKKRKNNI